MRSFIIALLSFFLVAFSQLNAQDRFSDIEKFEDGTFKIFCRFLSVKPSTDKAYGGWTINGAWATNEDGMWGTRKRWEMTAFSDAIAGVVKKHILKKGITKSGLDHAFSSGFLGSFQYYKNAMVKEGLLISPGLSAGDYIVALDRFMESGTAIFDPAGYFIVAGPSIMGSYMLNESRWIDAFITYELTLHKFKNTGLLTYQPSEGKYPHPHFLTFGLDIYGSSVLFGGLKFNTLINRGDVLARAGRIDLSIGVYLN